MRVKGINFDTGFFHAGTSSREPFDPAVVEREMRIIREVLNCTAVRITGGDLGRLEIAAAFAAQAGLEVWFCPFTNDLSQDELISLLLDCADRAEKLRAGGAEVVLFTGSELTITTRGFLPGDTLAERLSIIADPQQVRAHIGLLPPRINAFLARAVEAVRTRFGGPISYASLPFEGVDWTPFDIIASDAVYRSGTPTDAYQALVRSFVERAHGMGKRAAITEFGCMTFKGAARVRADAHQLVEWGQDGRAQKLKGELVRDEEEQATEIRECLEVFDAEGVDAAFIYTFARYDFPYSDQPPTDLDRVSCGLVSVLRQGQEEERLSSGRPDEVPWRPKQAFNAVAEYYRRH